MKKLILIVIALSLCGLVIVCTPKKETVDAEMWRTVEPRLAGNIAWRPCESIAAEGRRIVRTVRCGSAEEQRTAPRTCPNPARTRSDAQCIVAHQPDRMDEAIATLKEIARTERAAKSDLAAAYYVQAQHNDDPAKFLAALEAAMDAVAAAPRSPEALFNLALAQEVLGFTSDSIETWNRYLSVDDSQWATDGRDRRNKLTEKRLNDAAVRWPANRMALSDALRREDVAAVYALIEPFPRGAYDYLEEMVAQPERLAETRVLVEALRELTDDPYVIDAMDAMRPENRVALSAFETALTTQFGFRRGRTAASRKASALLERNSSALHLRTAFTHALGLSDTAPESAHELLSSVEMAAHERGYKYLLAQTAWGRGYIDMFSRYVESLNAYDVALSRFEDLRDPGSVAAIQSRRSAVMRMLGRYDLAWRTAFGGLGGLGSIVRTSDRNTYYGELAGAAMALGHPRAALLYQDAAVRIVEDQSRTATDPSVVLNVQANLAVALRQRANARVQLGDIDGAGRDLAEATRIGSSREFDPTIRRSLDARREEVRGQTLLRSNPEGALKAFRKALALAASHQPGTLRAILHIQIAAARRELGQHDAAAEELRLALQELHAEGQQMLAARQRGEAEETWRPYFSRFQEIYQQLIHHYATRNEAEKAFAIAERSRTTELVDLIRRLEVTPEAFREWTENGKAVELARIQDTLPPGAFLIEYAVFSDRTYAWIVSYDRFTMLPLDVTSDAIERWTADLQSAALHNEPARFLTFLEQPYTKLIAAPLRTIKQWQRGVGPERLVIVPDGAMHGLPVVALRNPVTKAFLIEEAPIEFAGSAAVYVASVLRNREVAVTDPSVLAVGDPAFDTSNRYIASPGALDGAKAEAEAVFRLYAGRGEMLIAEQATAPAFLSHAKDKHIVHFAGHAVVNPAVPSQSFLLLAPSSRHSGLLTAKELLTRLQLKQTWLVLMAACSSAGGLSVGREGVSPLVRPILAAGVPAVVGSLWPVIDATTGELLVSFHRRFQKSGDAAVALQAAQVDMLRKSDADDKSVLTWAPFQVIGHTSSPHASSDLKEKGKPP